MLTKLQQTLLVQLVGLSGGPLKAKGRYERPHSISVNKYK